MILPLLVASVVSLFVIDGDTVHTHGDKIRLMGFDTPETRFAKCAAERRLGALATLRLRQLIAEAKTLRLAPSGRRDRYHRQLAQLFIDGRDVADIMVTEGYARRYHGGKRKGWC